MKRIQIRNTGISKIAMYFISTLENCIIFYFRRSSYKMRHYTTHPGWSITGKNLLFVTNLFIYLFIYLLINQ